jgi:hypothetical protein
MVDKVSYSRLVYTNFLYLFYLRNIGKMYDSTHQLWYVRLPKGISNMIYCILLYNKTSFDSGVDESYFININFFLTKNRL